MPITLVCTIAWIPIECGGRAKPPLEGYRPTIRFQRDAKSWAKIAWDVTIARLDPDSKKVALAFSPDASPDREFVKAGELIELLEAYRVIGVGKILQVNE